MENIKANGFVELSNDDMQEVDGGWVHIALTIASWTVWLLFNTPSVCE